jgi:hypothetical protein
MREEDTGAGPNAGEDIRRLMPLRRVQLTGQPRRGHRPRQGCAFPGRLFRASMAVTGLASALARTPLTSGRQQVPELTPGQGGGAFLAEFVRFRVGFVR